MKGYTLSLDAAQDIDDIWEYIAEDNPEAAERVVESFLKACRMLGDYPRAGHTREDLAEDRPLRFWPVGNYLIIYRAEREPIEIVAVVHGGRDIPVFLRRRVG